MKKQTATVADAAPWMETVPVALDRIRISPQPRKQFKPEAQAELEASMRAHGFTLSSLLLRPMPGGYYIEEDAEKSLYTLCRKTAAGDTIREGTYGSSSEAHTELKRVEDCFELVAGERRLRAARAVGLIQAPAIIRQLTDQEVLEIQLVENLQREDLSPLEEAEGLRQLLDLRDSAGKAIHTKATVAERIGKSVREVERRLTLCGLDGDARKAVEAGVLPVATAGLIARIPDEKLREKAAKQILTPQYEEGPLSYKRAEMVLQRDFMRDLRGCTFDLANPELVPLWFTDGERTFGGACTDCPFRLGNRADAGDLPSAQHNMCLNPRCFETKIAAEWTLWQAHETDPARKRRGLDQEESERFYRHGDQLAWNCGMVDLADRPDSNDLRPGEDCSDTWKKLTKGKELEILVARDRLMKTHEIVRRDLALLAAEENGHTIFKTSVTKAAAQTAEVSLEQISAENQESRELRAQQRDAEILLEQQERLRVERIVEVQRKSVVEAIAHVKRLPIAFWRVLAVQLVDEVSEACGVEEIAERYGYKPSDEDADAEVDPVTWFHTLLANAEEPAAMRLVLDLVLEMRIPSSRYKELSPLRDWAAVFGVDIVAIEKTERDAMEAEQKALEQQSEIAAGVTSPHVQRDDASAFEWVAEGCVNPDVYALAFKKGDKGRALLLVAKHEKGYVTGYIAFCGLKRTEESCKHTGPFFNGRLLALENAAFRALSALTVGKASEPALERMRAYHRHIDELGKAELPLAEAPAPVAKKGKKGGRK